MDVTLENPRRSPCPVACALDILGDKWTLLVVRDLLLGRTRFKEFIASPEKIPTNILSERLTRLQKRGLIQQTPAKDTPKRQVYRLTQKGPTVLALRDWGLQWEPGTGLGPPSTTTESAAPSSPPA
jgi:DNA-binding HxlR family transcriptional regulator